MKKIKWSNILIAICYIVGGVLFFSNGKLTKEIICTWMGIGLLAIGLVLIVSYLIRPKHESFFKDDFADGLMYMTLGTLPFLRKGLFVDVVYLVLAIVIMISGYKKLQDGVDAYRFGSKHGVLYLVLAAISIVVGLIILLDSTLSEQTYHYLIGGGLLYSGISDLISAIFLSGKMIQYSRKMNKAEQAVEEKDPEQIVEQDVESEPTVEKEEILDDNNETPEL